MAVVQIACTYYGYFCSADISIIVESSVELGRVYVNRLLALSALKDQFGCYRFTCIYLITRDGDLICSNVTNIRCFSLEKGEISVKGAQKKRLR